MTFWQNVLRILDARMPEPQLYGWFHLLWLAISIGAAVWLCACYRDASRRTIINLVFGVAVTVIVMEVYKLINFSFEYEDGVVFDFSWYSFPWQFCSTPMYVGLLAGLIRKARCMMRCAPILRPSRFLPVLQLCFIRPRCLPKPSVSISRPCSAMVR